MAIEWTKHHLLYPLLGAALLAGATTAVIQHERAKNLEKDVAVQEAKQQAAEGAKQQIERERQAAAAEIAAARQQKPTVQTVTRWLPAPLPSGGQIEIQHNPATGQDQVVVTGDAQANLAAIQKMELDCASNKIDLTACTKTAAQTDIQLHSLQQETSDLKQLAIPRWTLTAAVSKSRDSGYKPAAMVDYRLFKSWGLSVGVVNNSLVGGVSIHFGGTAK